MLEGPWSYVASSNAALIVAIIVVALSIWGQLHTKPDGSLSKERIATILALAASLYTFGVLVCAELMLEGPPVSVLIREGFRDERIAWLLLAVLVDQGLRLWDILRQAILVRRGG